MRLRIGRTFVAMALVGTAMAALLPAAARAEVGISIDPGGIAFAYSDGYWDRDHHWHRWHKRSDAAWYRAHYKEHYYARKHGADRDHGWHDSDRWWDHH